MIPENVREEIMRRLADVEKFHNVKIIYAIESGSRAWGFPSPDSDYDVRFIYVHPKDWYFSLDFEELPTTIDIPITDEIDMVGWDIRKALKLLGDSNPAIIEWLQSPIVYRGGDVFKKHALAALSTLYSTEKGIKHYLSMAKNNLKEHLSKELIVTKKYFYVLRAVLACKYVLHFTTHPPIEFDRLVSEMVDVSDPVIPEIKQLLIQKLKGFERKVDMRNEVIDDFINTAIKQIDDVLSNETIFTPKDIDLTELNTLFQAYASANGLLNCKDKTSTVEYNKLLADVIVGWGK